MCLKGGAIASVRNRSTPPPLASVHDDDAAPDSGGAQISRKGNATGSVLSNGSRFLPHSVSQSSRLLFAPLLRLSFLPCAIDISADQMARFPPRSRALRSSPVFLTDGGDRGDKIEVLLPETAEGGGGSV